MISCRLNARMRQRLQKLADASGRSVASYVRGVLLEHVQQQQAAHAAAASEELEAAVQRSRRDAQGDHGTQLEHDDALVKRAVDEACERVGLALQHAGVAGKLAMAAYEIMGQVKWTG